MTEVETSHPSPARACPNHVQQDSQSAPTGVPYWPELKRAVGSVNAALALTYLEMHYPSPPPAPGRRYGLSVEVDFARMADDLAIDRRTLGIALICTATWYTSEVRRIGAARAGREFLNLKHSRFSQHKLYSIVAEREWKSLRTLTLRRNWPLLSKTLADAGVTTICAVPDPSLFPRPLPRQDLEKYAALPSPFSSLTEILMRGVELAGDRRKTRYSRLHKPVENGPVDADELKVRRNTDTEAVDPALSDLMKARISGRKSRRS